MRIYQLKPDVDHFESLVATKPRDRETLRTVWRLRAVPDTPILLEVADERSKLPISDYPQVASGLPVFSERALAALQPVLGAHGAVFPVLLANKPFYAMQIPVLNALDLNNCDAVMFEGRLMEIKKFAFDSGRIGDTPIFTAPGFFTDVFVQEAIVGAVSSNGLTGFEFRLVWEA